jgi:hypothetical protein
MHRDPSPIGWDDLPALQARTVALCNADLVVLRRLIFQIGDVRVRFQWTPPAADAAEVGHGTPSPLQRVDAAGPAGHQGAAPGVAAMGGDLAWRPAAWLWLEWAGVPLLAGVSPAWADALSLTLAGAAIDQLGDASLDLVGQLKLAPRLPAGLTLRQAARTRQGLDDGPDGLDSLGVWVARHVDTGEPSGHAVQLWAGSGFALQALLGAFVPLSTARQPSPLADLPLALPLVAARWHVAADQLLDLAVGDVLILG